MKNFTVVFVAISLAACTSTTTINSPNQGVSLLVNENPSASLDGGYTEKYTDTTFGNYRFKVTDESGQTMYGALPLRFNGGYLALDILFFAPAIFFNLRQVYPYYELDQVEGVIRYKRKEEDPWIEYRPSGPEAAAAKAYFGD
ncbi:MAG: hypothetical protein OER91_03085 [Gammaproteobacteria bacterium]|nr:hypothetical protein [Gammaproteobacteria bacterium]